MAALHGARPHDFTAGLAPFTKFRDPGDRPGSGPVPLRPPHATVAVASQSRSVCGAGAHFSRGGGP